MKDCFENDISVGDTVVYGTRTGSSQHMHLAKIDETFSDRVKATVIAGTDYEWTSGRLVWNQETKAYDHNLFESRNVTLRTPRNLMVITGFDADKIHERIMDKQRENIAKRSE